MKSLGEIKNSIKKDFIVNGMLKSEGVYCLVALPKVGKSMLALQLSDSIANNKQFLGFEIKPSPVLYVSTENSGSQLYERTKLMNIEFTDDNFKFIDRNQYPVFYLRDLEYDIKQFSESGGKLLIIDMIKDIKFDKKIETNSYDDIGQVAIPKLREYCYKYHLTILFVHHLNKKGKSLGSTAYDGAVDGILRLTQSSVDKKRYRLVVDNRDYEGLDLSLIKDDKCILSVCHEEDDEEELDINLVLLIKYAISKIEFEFTCSSIIKDLNLTITPKRFGKLLNSNIKRLECEGLHIISNRVSNARKYIAKYEEPIIENE
ncbi:MAG: AAA family ATPase [Bacilli bacterium]|nr:AAA family ATPase [Bacilli bacterium]